LSIIILLVLLVLSANRYKSAKKNNTKNKKSLTVELYILSLILCLAVGFGLFNIASEIKRRHTESSD